MVDWAFVQKAPNGFRCQAIWIESRVALLGGFDVQVDGSPSPRSRIAEKTAAIAHRLPGESDWKVTRRGPSEITHLAAAGDTLFALGLDLDKDCSFLLRSDDAGRMWAAVDIAGIATLQLLRGLAFSTPKLGYLWSEHALVWTRDGGITWQHGANYQSRAGSLILAAAAHPGGLWLATEDGLIHIDSEGFVESERGPSGMKLDALNVSGGALWIAGRTDAQAVRLVERTSASTYARMAELPRFLPGHLFQVGRTVLVLGIDVNKTSPGYMTMTSTDGGATWAGEMAPPIPALYLSSDHVLWGCDGVGRIVRGTLPGRDPR